MAEKKKIKDNITKIRKELNETSKNSFKEASKIVFAKKNMWMLAIGVIIGGAISAIINSIANDLIMSPISAALGFESLDDWVVGGVAIGKFLGTILSFFILALTLLIMVFIVLFIYRSIMRKYGAKNIQEIKKAVPTTQHLMLEELKQINEKLSKNHNKKK